MPELRIEPISPDKFAPYGKYLGKPAQVPPTSERSDLKVWLNISDLLGLDASHGSIGYVEFYRHDQPVKQMERHRGTPEAFIALEGSSVIVVAPPGDPNDPNDAPDMSRARAFLLAGGEGVFVPAGSWHWAPFAITDKASFLLLVSSKVLDDIEVKSVPDTLLRLY